MTPKAKKALSWSVSIFVALGGLVVVGMAAQFWISTEVAAQVKALPIVVVPDTTQLTTDVEIIKNSIANIESNGSAALESQQRFEDIFTQYLIDQGARSSGN